MDCFGNQFVPNSSKIDCVAQFYNPLYNQLGASTTKLSVLVFGLAVIAMLIGLARHRNSSDADHAMTIVAGGTMYVSLIAVPALRTDKIGYGIVVVMVFAIILMLVATFYVMLRSRNLDRGSLAVGQGLTCLTAVLIFGVYTTQLLMNLHAHDADRLQASSSYGNWLGFNIILWLFVAVSASFAVVANTFSTYRTFRINNSTPVEHNRHSDSTESFNAAFADIISREPSFATGTTVLGNGDIIRDFPDDTTQQ
jgi:hypothetical protein